jgi:hypothetical protein
MNGDSVHGFIVPECFFSQSEQAFNHQIPHSANAYSLRPFWRTLKLCSTTFSIFPVILSLIYHEWRLPSIICPWMCFSQSECKQPSEIPLSK